MAGVLTQSNSFKLTGKIGRRPTDGELYMAHFMGVGGAAKLINERRGQSAGLGARMFPNAAAANRSIFYDQQGSARSVSEVYSELNARYASAANSPATRTRDDGGSRENVQWRARRLPRSLHDAAIDNASLPLANSRCPQRYAGRRFIERGQQFASARSDLPFVVSGR